MKRLLTLPFLLLGFSILPATGQIGDKAGEAQVPLVPDTLIPPAPALSARDELKTFQIAPGYKIELVASDPLIGDPVAITFGPDGRIWVVEMRGYMPDLEGSGEDKPLGRIVVLSDTDGDGLMDKREVFLDNITLPRAIALAHGGVLVGAPPYLWFCRDTNGDEKADNIVEVAHDFGVQVDPARPQLANPERAPNSLLWALDNWIYAGAYSAKFRYKEGEWTREVSTFRGQWGLSQDDFGRLFYNSNSDQLRADILPSFYTGRNPHQFKPTGTNWKVAKDQFVYPARVNPGINRGYRQESLWTEPGLEYRLKEFTAACAPWIYRGNLFPKDAYGNAFICEPAGNLIKRNILESENGTPIARNAYTRSEFLTSTDERFRPVNLTTGPDGALYIVDFYRGIIQHRISLTSYLRHQIELRGLDQPLALGRIWRIVPDGSKPAPEKPLSSETPAEWIQELGHPNSWRRETAQRLLVENGSPDLIKPLCLAATTETSALGRMHALWALHGINTMVPWKVVKLGLQDEAPVVRVAALRISEAHLQTESKADLLSSWQAMAAHETTPEVLLQLALSMGEAKDSGLDLAMASLLTRAPELPFLKDAVLSGLSGRELELLEHLLNQDSSANSPFITDLARCVFAERNPNRINRLLNRTAGLPVESSALQTALLKALATHPTVNTKYPLKFSQEPTGLAAIKTNSTPSLQSLLKQVEQAMVWPGKVGMPTAEKIVALTAEEKLRFDSGKQLFLGLCAACHQPHGKGMEGLAPPLTDSEWVLGSVERLGRIVLHGVRGPIKVKGSSYNLDMPAMGLLDDTQLASVLTYIRREWDHTATPVQPQSLRQIRETNQSRKDAWTEPELLAIP